MDGGKINQENNNEDLLRKYFFATIISIIIIVSLAGFLGFLFNDTIEELTELIVSKTGIIGLVLMILVADSVLPAFPTDIILLIIAKSSLFDNWIVFVMIIGVTSIIAGMIGWNVGKWIRTKTNIKWLAKHRKNTDLLKKYGFIGVVIGALTPIPFSLTCWTAGFLKMPFKQFALASFFRIPRYFLYFIAINYSDEIIGLFF